MRVLCINAGSSSVKVSLYEVASDAANGASEPQLIVSKSLHEDEDAVATLRHFVEQQEAEEAAHAEAVAAMSAELNNKSNGTPASASAPAVTLKHPRPIRLIVHRIVHGGTLFHAPTLLEEDTIKQLATLNSLAPLHNPPALRWINASHDAFCHKASTSSAAKGSDDPPSPRPHRHSVRQIAIFDTSFFAELPQAATTYALPKELVAKHHLRRYGFHGIAHEDMLRVAALNVKGLEKAGRLITLQLGSGCSAAAILNGHPVDTSMGFAPLEGLVMSTRCGDVDPGVLTFLMRNEPALATKEKMEEILYYKSGFQGLSGGFSKDMKQLEEAAAKGNEDAILTVQVFLHRLMKYVGAYVAILGGLDTLCFGGGIGEHSATVRASVIQQLAKFLPVQLDEAANRAVKNGVHTKISAEGSKIQVWVVAVDEGALMLRDALLLTEPSGQQSQL